MTIEILETGENTGESTYTPLTDDDVKKIGMDLFKEQIFGSWMLPKHSEGLLGSIFMVLLFLDDLSLKQQLVNGAAHVFEYMDQAGPRSINGYPIFMSCRILNLADTQRIIAKRNEIAALLDGVS